MNRLPWDFFSHAVVYEVQLGVIFGARLYNISIYFIL